MNKKLLNLFPKHMKLKLIRHTLSEQKSNNLKASTAYSAQPTTIVGGYEEAALDKVRESACLWFFSEWKKQDPTFKQLYRAEEFFWLVRNNHSNELSKFIDTNSNIFPYNLYERIIKNGYLYTAVVEIIGIVINE